MTHPKPVVIVAGPTASGKSALAARLAGRFGGVVINADAMQLYRDLKILTARPDRRARAAVPHCLYGVLQGDDPSSAGRWRAMAEREIDAAHAAGQLPILAGGTGMYLRALMSGLAHIPKIPADIRAAARDLLAREGAVGLHAKLARIDPDMAARLDPGDSQRLMRAWEVRAATGRSLADWQRAPDGGPRPDWRFTTFTLLPPRAVLYTACDDRFTAMMAAGALDEVRALLARGLDPDLPVMKAVGVRELGAHLAGACGLDEAVAAARQATRRYAKRQLTWLRHQIIPDLMIEAQFSEKNEEKFFSYIVHNVLTGTA